MAVQSTDKQPSMGIMQFHSTAPKFQLKRYSPSEDIAFFTKHYWIIHWDLTGQPAHVQAVVPNPCVNMVIEAGQSAIYRPAREVYTQRLADRGCVFGVKFKPGAFYPFIKQPVSQLGPEPIHIRQIFDVDARVIERSVLSQPSDEEMIPLVEQFIRPKLPKRDENVVLLGEIIDHIINSREITKVDEVCGHFSLNKRKLQRLFDQYVGINPKWVIKLYRLQNAAEAMDTGHFTDLTQLSHELGYYDQSHFIRDFKKAVGQTPEEYVKSIHSS